MTFERFKEIFAELGITDERIVRMHWIITQAHMNTSELREDKLRWSIRKFILGQKDVGKCP